MKRCLYILLPAILAYGCGLFKNTGTDRENSHQLLSAERELKTLEQKDWLDKSGSINLYRDSSNLNYTIQIWPKGAFNFSQNKGFSGEAEKILVQGSAKVGSLATAIYSSEQRDKATISKTVAKKSKQVSDEHLKVKQSSPSWKWVLAGSLTVALLCWFIYRKLT